MRSDKHYQHLKALLREYEETFEIEEENSLSPLLAIPGLMLLIFFFLLL